MRLWDFDLAPKDSGFGYVDKVDDVDYSFQNADPYSPLLSDKS
jgi:hypothetical protein